MMPEPLSSYSIACLSHHYQRLLAASSYSTEDGEGWPEALTTPKVWRYNFVRTNALLRYTTPQLTVPHCSPDNEVKTSRDLREYNNRWPLKRVTVFHLMFEAKGLNDAFAKCTKLTPFLVSLPVVSGAQPGKKTWRQQLRCNIADTPSSSVRTITIGFLPQTEDSIRAPKFEVAWIAQFHHH